MKVPRGLSRMEQETFFRTNALTETGWEFYTRDPKWKRRLERRGYEVKEDHQGLWSCTLPTSSLTIRSANRKKRMVNSSLKGRFLPVEHRSEGNLNTLDLKVDGLPVPPRCGEREGAISK